MNNQININTQQNPDEIDLIELIVSIWHKKWWVILIIFLFATGGVCYALIAKEQWTSKAEIIAPNIKEMGNYLDVYERYSTIIDQNQSNSQEQNPNQNQNQNLSQSEKAAEKLFNGFVSAIGSYENQINFLQQSDILKTQIKSGTEKSKAMIELIPLIKVEKPSKDKKKGDDFLSVNFSDTNAEAAQKTLSTFVDFINADVRQTMVDDLITEIETKIKTLKIRKERIKLYTDTAQKVRLENLHKALLTAQKAGVYDYSLVNRNGNRLPSTLTGEAGIQLEDDRLAEGNFLFLLGEKYLSAQIDTLKNTAAVYPENYYQSDLQISLLSQLLETQKKFGFDTYHYQSSPSLPLKHEKPKRALIILIGCFAGVVLGVLVALLMAAMESRRKRLA